MAIVIDERATRTYQTAARGENRGTVGGRVAIFLDGHNPITRQVARGVMEFMPRIQAGRSGRPTPENTPWSIVLADDLANTVPSADDGFLGVIGSPDDDRLAIAIKAGNLPIVSVACCCEPQPLRSLRLSAQVAFDEERIGALAAQHLVACGLTSLAYVTTAQHLESRGRAFERHARALHRSCQVERLGAPLGDASSAEPRLRQLCRWLESQTCPIGVFACDDSHGRLVIDACRRVGRRVPEDVAVLGVGNDDIACGSTSPPLSSIDPGFSRLGVAAAETLEAILRPRPGRSTPRLVTVAPVGVVTRQSTDVLSTDDEFVSRALQILRGQPLSDVSVEGVAKVLGLSRSSLEQRFRKTLGYSMHAEIVRTRLAEVQRLIGDPRLSLKQVASNCGFGSVSYMTTFLKKHLGVTPGQLRHRRTADAPCEKSKP